MLRISTSCFLPRRRLYRGYRAIPITTKTTTATTMATIMVTKSHHKEYLYWAGRDADGLAFEMGESRGFAIGEDGDMTSEEGAGWSRFRGTTEGSTAGEAGSLGPEEAGGSTLRGTAERSTFAEAGGLTGEARNLVSEARGSTLRGIAEQSTLEELVV